MSLLAEAFRPTPRAATPGDSLALNEFWYTRDPSGFLLERNESGLALSADSILACSTVLAAVRFRADLWAMSPPVTYRKTRFGRTEDPEHPSQIVLRNPNRWQTGNRWRHLNGVWLATWGNGYNEIIGGSSSFAEELRPLHPSLVTVDEQRDDGSLVYLYRHPKERERRITQDRMLHFRDVGTDGFSGLHMYRLIRNAVGIALLAERHQMTFLRKGARISGLLVPEKPLEADQRKTLMESVNKEVGGASMTGAFGILPPGVKIEPITMPHREGQLIELGDRAVGSILMMLGVPGVVVGWQGDKTSTYASAEAYFEKGGIRHTLLPLLTNIEAEEEKALLLRGDGRQIKHNIDALMRGAWKDRIEGLVKATGGPILTRNEARAIEDWNELPGEEFDTLLTPQNMSDGQEEEPEAPQPPPPPVPPEPEDDDEAEAVRLETEKLRAELASERERLSALESKTETQGRLLAERVIRREMRAVTERAKTHAQDGEAWEKWLRGYYARHVSHVMEALGCSEQSARVHCERQAEGLLKDGLRSIETWEHAATARLIAIAGERGN